MLGVELDELEVLVDPPAASDELDESLDEPQPAAASARAARAVTAVVPIHLDRLVICRYTDCATVAFIASVPRNVNLTEITILPTQQAV